MLQKKFWLVPALLLLVGGIAVAATRTAAPPPDLDYSLAQPTADGLYQVTLVPGIEPVPVGKMHTWLVAVTDSDGKSVDAEVVMDGGMPQHGHGLPTVPKVTGKDPQGRHIVGGMRFNMPGWWVLTIDVSGARGTDKATFNLVL